MTAKLTLSILENISEIACVFMMCVSVLCVRRATERKTNFDRQQCLRHTEMEQIEF